MLCYVTLCCYVTGTLEAHEPPWKRKQALYFTVCDSTNLTVSVLSHVLLRHNDVLKVQPLPDEDVVEWVVSVWIYLF